MKKKLWVTCGEGSKQVSTLTDIFLFYERQKLKGYQIFESCISEAFAKYAAMSKKNDGKFSADIPDIEEIFSDWASTYRSGDTSPSSRQRFAESGRTYAIFWLRQRYSWLTSTKLDIPQADYFFIPANPFVVNDEGKVISIKHENDKTDAWCNFSEKFNEQSN